MNLIVGLEIFIELPQVLIQGAPIYTEGFINGSSIG
jgi:hypothetical protein